MARAIGWAWPTARICIHSARTNAARSAASGIPPFEFESRNFREHGHDARGCDVIVCWRHNWTECPPELEVVELMSVIQTLSKSDE